MNKKIIFTLLIATLSFCNIYAQYDKIVMHSNQEDITLMIGGGENSWSINPSLKPDVFRFYSETEQFYKLKFISDIDSLEFNVEVNKPVFFSIIYNGDTAQTKIDFINYIPNTLSDNEKLYALSLIWSEAKYNFVFIDKLKFDLDSLYCSYIPKVLATKNDCEFNDKIRLFIASFKDGHTNGSFDEAYNYMDYNPVGVRYFNEELYIVTIREDLEKTFPIGSKIIEVNGMPLNEYMKKHVEPYIYSDFEPTVRVLSASELFSHSVSSNILTIKYQTPKGKILTNALPRDGNEKPGKYAGKQQKYGRKSVEIKWEKNGIAILEFNTFNDFNDRLIPYFEQIKDTLYSAKGIIIDIRQNRGGSTAVAQHLLQYIVKEPYFLNYAWQTRINDGVKKANGNWKEEYEDFYKYTAYRTVMPDTIFIPDTIKRFDVPIAILISTMTVSAAEDFLIDLYEIPNRPVIIGRPSFGSTGSPLVLWDFPEGGSARICTRRVLYPYSLKPFTEGVSPDILVNYTYDEYMSDKDKDVEVAIQELTKQLQKTKGKK